jgi:hypothetical protein
MVRLYLLGFTHDLKGVVFSRRRNGRTAAFWVPVDDQFLAALSKLERAKRDRDRTGRTRGGRKGDVLDLSDLPAAARTRALPPVGRSQARAGMPASEIQKMLREGRTVKNVAAAAKTPIEWVERLAEPVLTERMGVVRLAQRAYMQRPRLGASSMQLGDAVRINLEARGANTDFEGIDAAWDARARSSGTWRVWFRFNHRGKRRVAEWEFKKGSRTILPRNRLAGQLGWAAPEAEHSEPVEPRDGEAGEGADQQAQGSRPTKPRSRGRTSRSRSRTKRSRPTSRSAKRAPARKKVTKPRRGRPSQRRRR